MSVLYAGVLDGEMTGGVVVVTFLTQDWTGMRVHGSSPRSSVLSASVPGGEMTGGGFE